MLRITLLFALLAAMALVFACTAAPSGGTTPTEAYKLLYAAVKSKNTEEIKKQLTKKSIEFGVFASQQNKSPIEKVYENGFTATTFSETLPTMRDERINGDMAALEVWNSRDSRWEDLPFMKEDGGWKLAWGDQWSGTYKSPGPGRDIIEKQAANAAANSNIQTSTSNANSPIPVTNMNPIASNKLLRPKR